MIAFLPAPLWPIYPCSQASSLHACFLGRATYHHNFLLHIYTIASFWAWNPISKVLLGLLHRHLKFSMCPNTTLWSPIPLLLYLHQRRDQLTISQVRGLENQLQIPPLFLTSHSWLLCPVTFTWSTCLKCASPNIPGTHCLSSPSCLEKWSQESFSGASLSPVHLLHRHWKPLSKLNQISIIPGFKFPRWLTTFFFF